MVGCTAESEMMNGGEGLKQFCGGAGKLITLRRAQKYAIVYFHIEEFRFINYLFGWKNGTKVLTGVERVLCRQAKPGELCTHIEADRFLLLLGFQSENLLTERLRAILFCLRETIEFYGIHYEMVPSMGIYIIEEQDGKNLFDMVNKAVIAARSQRHPVSPYAFFESGMCELPLLYKNMQDRLLPAINNHEFEVFYQPKYRLADSRIMGAEALVRWRTDPETLVPPSEFVPAFEECGVIPLLDAYVFDRVCADLKRWLNHGWNPVPVSVNISRVSLRNVSLIREYRAVVRGYGLPPELLELELTESALAEDPEALRKFPGELHEAGFKLAVDDFGAGYSSLKLLRDLPADTLKLDKEFLCGAWDGGRGRAVTAAAVRLAGELKMTVVAEGVETGEQRDFLARISCTAAQGYLFSRPVSCPDYELLLQKAC